MNGFQKVESSAELKLKKSIPKIEEVKKEDDSDIDFEDLIDKEVQITSSVKSKVNEPRQEPEIIKLEEKSEVLLSNGNSNLIYTTPTKNSNSDNLMILQNQSIIDMALLNNSLLSATLATLSPPASTSKEAISATAFIINYNSQIINTLSNNLLNSSSNCNSSRNVTMPYNNLNNGLMFPQNFCDKFNNERKPEQLNESEQKLHFTGAGANGNGTSNSNAKGDTEGEEGDTTNSCDSFSQSSSVAEAYYKHLLQWYDVNYAYSGLHSIVNPPPENVDMWDIDSKINNRINSDHLKRISQNDSYDNSETDSSRKEDNFRRRSKRKKPPECDFCLTQYGADFCQFYRAQNQDFKVKIMRNGKKIVCECCDYTEDEEELEGNTEDDCAKLDSSKDDKEKVVVRAGWFGKGTYYNLKTGGYRPLYLHIFNCLPTDNVI